MDLDTRFCREYRSTSLAIKSGRTEFTKKREPARKDSIMERRYNHLVIPIMLYLLASFVDYFFTSQGIVMGIIIETNPFLKLTIRLLGIHQGIFLPKMLFGIAIILLLVKVDRERLSNGKKFHAEYILYPAAIITLLIGVSWLL